MSENIIMPKLGMTMKEGTVEEWFKAEGDVVEQGESICTISSEKLTQDVEAPASGTLLEIKVQAGEETEVKSVLGIMETKAKVLNQVVRLNLKTKNKITHIQKMKNNKRAIQLL